MNGTKTSKDSSLDSQDGLLSDVDPKVLREIKEIQQRGSGYLYDTVLVEKIALRRYNQRQDSFGSTGIRTKTPSFTIVTTSGQGKSFCYSRIETIQVLAQDVENNYRSRILLECAPKSVGDPLWYAANSIVNHHNALMDSIYPVLDENPNPFAEHPRGVNPRIIDIATLLENVALEQVPH